MEDIKKLLGGDEAPELPIVSFKLQYPDPERQIVKATFTLGDEQLALPILFMPFGKTYYQYVKFVDEKPVRSIFFTRKEMRAYKHKYPETDALYKLHSYQIIYLPTQKKVAFWVLKGATLKAWIDAKVGYFHLYSIKGLQTHKKGAITYYTPIIEEKQQNYVDTISESDLQAIQKEYNDWLHYVNNYNGVFDSLGASDTEPVVDDVDF